MKRAAAILCWLLCLAGPALAQTTIPGDGHSAETMNVTTAIEFLEEMTSSYAEDCRWMLRTGGYSYGPDTHTTGYNYTQLLEDLVAPRGPGREVPVPDGDPGETRYIIGSKKYLDRKVCTDFKEIASLAITMVHETHHATRQSSLWRSKHAFWDEFELNAHDLFPHPAEQDAWGATLVELDKWITMYKDAREKGLATLKKLQEEEILIELKLEKMREYRDKNRDDYGPISWEVVAEVVDLHPRRQDDDPEDAIEDHLKEQLGDVRAAIKKMKEMEVSGPPGPEPPNVPLPPRKSLKDEVKRTPGSREEDCAYEFRATGSGVGRVVEVTATNRTDLDIPFNLPPGLRFRAGDNTLVVGRPAQVTIPARQTLKIPLEGCTLQPDAAPPEPGTPATLDLRYRLDDFTRDLLLSALALDSRDELRSSLPREQRMLAALQLALWRQRSAASPMELARRQSERMGWKAEVAEEVLRDEALLASRTARLARFRGLSLEDRDESETLLLLPPMCR